MKINRYTQTVIRPREVARLDDPNAISAASQMTNLAAGIAKQQLEIQDATKLSKASIDYRRDKMDLMDSLTTQYGLEPDKFEDEYRKQSDELYNKYAKDMRFGVRKQFGDFRQKVDFEYENKAKAWKTQRTVEIAVDTLDEGGSELAIMGARGHNVDKLLEEADVLVAATSSLVKDPFQLKQLRDGIRKNIISAKFDALMQKGELGAAKALLDSKKYDDDLGAEGITRGYGAIQAEAKRRQASAQQAELLNALVKQNMPVDPASKEHRDAINQGFVESGLYQAVLQGDKQALKETINLTAKTSVIPESMQSTVRGWMNSQDDTQKEWAYSYIGGLVETTNNIDKIVGAGGFKEKEVQDALAYNSMRRNGVDHITAVDRIKDSKSPITTEIREIRQSQINEKRKKLNYVTNGNNFRKFKKLATPNQLDRLKSAWMSNYEAEFMLRGDEEVAENFADTAIKNLFGESNLGGKKRLMERPPEAQITTDLPPKEKIKVLENEVKSILGKNRHNKDLSNKFLVPTYDIQSRLENGLKPTYNIVDLSNGAEVLRGKDNLPIKYELDETPFVEHRKSLLADKNQEAFYKASYRKALAESEKEYNQKYPLSLNVFDLIPDEATWFHGGEAIGNMVRNKKADWMAAKKLQIERKKEAIKEERELLQSLGGFND